MKFKCILLYDFIFRKIYIGYRECFVAQTGIIYPVESRYGFTGCRAISK